MPTKPAGGGEQKAREILAARRKAHDANQLLVDILDRWGGTGRFAEDLYGEFQAAKPGSLIRQNILEMVQKLVVNNSNHNLTRTEDLSHLDDADLRQRHDAYAARVAAFLREADAGAGPAVRRPVWEEDEPPPFDAA